MNHTQRVGLYCKALEDSSALVREHLYKESHPIIDPSSGRHGFVYRLKTGNDFLVQYGAGPLKETAQVSMFSVLWLWKAVSVSSDYQ